MTMQPYRDAGVRCVDAPRFSCPKPPPRRKWVPLTVGLGVAIAFGTGVAAASVGASRGRIEIDSTALVHATKRVTPSRKPVGAQPDAHAWLRGSHNPSTLYDRALTLQEMGLDLSIVTVRRSAALGGLGFEDGDQLLGVDGYTIDDDYAGYRPVHDWSIVEINRHGHHLVLSIYDAVR
jgi:hypothetical protein